MVTITEGNLTFEFPDAWQVAKFDEWSFYRHQFQKVCGGAKAMDIIAIDPNKHLWTIEVKDYRQHQRTKPSNLAEEVAYKVRDSLAALVAAGVNANNMDERAIARNAVACDQIRVVLHLEQPKKPSRLFPRAIDPANVAERLRQLLRAIDPHAIVVEKSTSGNAGWSVR